MNDTTPNPKVLWAVLQFILPVILAMIAGYGAVKYTAGETQAKIAELERRVTENRADVNRLTENQITRREMQQYIDQTKTDLQEIKQDLRELRKR
jgi:F0F1-type ATP synthase membrane subunit b/b'